MDNNGKTIGGYTIDILRERMSPEERAYYDSLNQL